MSNSLSPHGLQPTRLLCPWNFPGKNTGVGCHVLLQGIFPTQGSNLQFLCLQHWQVDFFLPPSHRLVCLSLNNWADINYARHETLVLQQDTVLVLKSSWFRSTERLETGGHMSSWERHLIHFPGSGKNFQKEV